jgi:hypothetical protein
VSIDVCLSRSDLLRSSILALKHFHKLPVRQKGVLIVKNVIVCNSVLEECCLSVEEKRAEMNLYKWAVAGEASQANLRDTYAAVVAVDTVTSIVT